MNATKPMTIALPKGVLTLAPMPMIRALSILVLLALSFGSPARSQGLVETTKLTVSDLTNDKFGFSVALGGDTALIGALGRHSAHVLVRNGATWTEQAELLPSTATANEFGISVALDGNTALVGDRTDEFGKVYVFVRNGTTWTEQARLTPPDIAPGSLPPLFGQSVALSGDTALVGARADDAPGTNSGSAYVFVRSGSTWALQQKLTASDGASGDQFGFPVAVDGDTALVGARLDDDAGTNSGSAYVFVRSGSTWALQQKLTASDAASGDQFGGYHVAVEGDTALVGAVLDDDAGADSGSTYVFVRSGSAWSQQAKLTASDGEAGDWFGSSAALEGDMALVGAHLDDDGALTDSGSAYIFVRNGTTWTEQQKLTASDAAADDYFGQSVALSENTALVGAYSHGEFTDSGAAYVFSLPAASVSEYGAGCQGTGGLVPVFSFSGSASPGSVVSLDVSNAVGGTHACILVGGSRASTPVLGCTLLIGEPLAGAAILVVGPAGVAGAGSGSLPVEIPSFLLGVQVNLQVAIADSGAAFGVSSTNALEIFVGF